MGIRALDEQGNLGGLSNPLAVTTATQDVPPPPAPVTQVVVVWVGTQSAVLELRHPVPPDGGLPVTGYAVGLARSPITLETWGQADTTAPGPKPGPPDSTANWTLSGLAPGTEWFVAVRTRDAAGQLASLSPVVSFRTEQEDLSPPAAPGAPEAAWSKNGDFLAITWGPSGDPRVVGYRIFGQGLDGSWRPMEQGIVTVSHYELAPAAVAGLRRLAITAVTASGAESPLSLAYELTADSWSVEGPFPQPVTDGCRVNIHVPADFPADANLRVEILDLLGHRVGLLHDGPAIPGAPLVLNWDRSSAGHRAGPGYHYLRVDAPGHRVLRTIYLAP